MISRKARGARQVRVAGLVLAGESRQPALQTGRAQVLSTAKLSLLDFIKAKRATVDATEPPALSRAVKLYTEYSPEVPRRRDYPVRMDHRLGEQRGNGLRRGSHLPSPRGPAAARLAGGNLEGAPLVSFELVSALGQLDRKRRASVRLTDQALVSGTGKAMAGGGQFIAGLHGGQIHPFSQAAGLAHGRANRFPTAVLSEYDAFLENDFRLRPDSPSLALGFERVECEVARTSGHAIEERPANAEVEVPVTIAN